MTNGCSGIAATWRMRGSMTGLALSVVLLVGFDTPGQGAASQSTSTGMGETAAARLLMQGTFGASPGEIRAVAGESYATWFAAQVQLSPTHETPLVPNWNGDRQLPWWTVAVTAQDQLRQRVAFALSEIFVVSQANTSLLYQGRALSEYYDLLVDNAFGTYANLLRAISASPVMGQYLTYFRNYPPDVTIGTHADENYARELMQLFSVGLWQLNPDGSKVLNTSGQPIPTYTQAQVTNLARVFTGWASHYPTATNQTQDFDWTYGDDLNDPMSCYPTGVYHDSGTPTGATTPVPKVIIGLNPQTGGTIAGGYTVANGSCVSEMHAALTQLANHPNVAPFLGRQLIERLVTSNPSPQYIARVSKAFNDSGGSLKAMVYAILTDPDATVPVLLTTMNYDTGRLHTAADVARAGKLREPILRLTSLWRAFQNPASPPASVAEPLLLNGASEWGEASLQSPTVFNFFQPTYQVAGMTPTTGFVAPEFQIVNSFSLIESVNDFKSLAYNYRYQDGATTVACYGSDGYRSGANPATTVLLDPEEWLTASSDVTTGAPTPGKPGALVDQLNLVFMAGQMPAAMQDLVAAYIAGIPLNQDGTAASCFNPAGSSGGWGPAMRAIEAADLVVNSPQFAIQR